MQNDAMKLYNNGIYPINAPSLASTEGNSEVSDDILFDNTSTTNKAQGTLTEEELRFEENIEFVSSLDNTTQQALVDVLDNLVTIQEDGFQKIKENNGFIAKGWDWFKNKTGLGQGSDKTQTIIDEYKKQIEELKNSPETDPQKLVEIYESVTGNELSKEEFVNLCNGEADFSNCEVIKSVSKYVQGQKMCTDIISSMSSALTIAGLIAGGIVAAPFTGGLSLGASFAALGTLTAAGTAAYMAPQMIDGFSEKDGYSPKEFAQDLTQGALNSAITAISMGTGKALSASLASQTTTKAGKTALQFAATEASSVIMGDGIAVGNYLIETAFNDELDFSLKDLGKVSASATAASLAAGGTGFATSSVLRPILTAGTTAQSQIAGRLFTSAISGSAAATSATVVAGGTNYLISCSIDGKEVTFDEFIDAATQNLGAAAITGFGAGLAFEGIQIAAGTPKPQGTFETKKCITEEGREYEVHLDKDGKVLALDIDPKVFQVQKEGLIEQGTVNNTNTTARTLRFSFSEVQNNEYFKINDNTYIVSPTGETITNVNAVGYDWAGNVYNLANATIPQAPPVYNTGETTVNSDVISSETSLAQISSNQELAIAQNNELQTQQIANTTAQLGALVSNNLNFFISNQNAQTTQSAPAIEQNANDKEKSRNDEITKTDSTNSRYEELTDLGLESYEISAYEDLTDAQYKRALELIAQNGLDYSIPIIASLPEDRYEILINTTGYRELTCYIDEIAKLDQTCFERFTNITQQGTNTYSALKIAQLDDNSYKNYEILQQSDKELDESTKIEIAQFDNETFSKYQNLIKLGAQAHDAKKIAKQDNTNYKKYYSALEQGLDSYLASEIVKLEDETYDTFQHYFIEKNMSPTNAIGLATQYIGFDTNLEKAVELTSKGIEYSTAIEYAQQDEQTQNKITTILESGYSKTALASIVSNKEALESIYQQALKKTNATIDFLQDESYNAKIKKAAQGKYQTELTKMFSLDTMTYDTRKQLIDSNLSEQDLLESIKKLSTSTYKLAMNTPNQYLSDIDTQYTTKVNGKYPKLPDSIAKKQQRKITEFFQEHIGQMTRALKYIDTDTLNQMMDKRTELFEESLKQLDSLSDENYELLSQLIKCKNETTSKALTANEKIQLCQIVEIFQKAGLDTDILKTIAQKGSVDLEIPKQHIQDAILERSGVSLSEISQQGNKPVLNDKYSYLVLMNTQGSAANLLLQNPEYIESTQAQIIALRTMDDDTRKETIEQLRETIDYAPKNMQEITAKAMEKLILVYENPQNYTDEEILQIMLESSDDITQELQQVQGTDEIYTVIKEGALGNFDKFITDENNHYGQTNAQTKQAFIEAGLDYDRWLDPEIDDMEVGFQGKKLTLKMWERNPLEDLFMGNKTTCCTAIGTGGNAAATPVYLLNTSYNVVELFDEQGEMVGMSRVFMTQSDEKPTLIMDNIELNKTYFKDATSEDLKAIRDGFGSYMGQYVKQVAPEKDSQVYFYSGDIHVPKDDLERVNATVDFIGSLSQDSVYVNSAKCSWIDVTKISDKEDIPWLKIPTE